MQRNISFNISMSCCKPRRKPEQNRIDGGIKMKNEFVEENQGPIYDYEDCANMIQEKTGLPMETIADVLNAEIDYMKSIGIIDEDEDAYFQA